MGAEVNAADVPLSDAAHRQKTELSALLSGGDDYQVLAAIPPEREEAADALAESWCLRFTCIGTIKEAPGVEFLDGEGVPVALGVTGWQHRF